MYCAQLVSILTVYSTPKENGDDELATYDELLDFVAVKCEGFSGASLAGVVRAAASRALERAVCDFASETESTSIVDCLVTKNDIEFAIEDVLASSGRSDGGEEDDEKTKVKEDDKS